MLSLKSISHNFLRSLCSAQNLQHLYLRLFIFLLPLALSLAPLSLDGSAEALTLAWDPNTEPDLEGYGVYQSEGSPGPPYELIEDLAENNLANPLNPEVTITGLNEGIKYYFATTAYDTAGNESDFSNEVCVQVSEDSVQVCSESASPDLGGNFGGSGGSGGCFISSIMHDAPQNLEAAGLKNPGSRELMTILFMLLFLICTHCMAGRLRLLKQRNRPISSILSPQSSALFTHHSSLITYHLSLYCSGFKYGRCKNLA